MSKGSGKGKSKSKTKGVFRKPNIAEEEKEAEDEALSVEEKKT